MFEDDDFFLDGDELDMENNLTVIDNAKKEVLEHIEKLSNEMKMNLKFGEIVDYNNNLMAISRELDILIKLSSVEDQNLTDEEQLDIIKQAQRMTTELTFKNIDDFIEKDENNNEDVSSNNSNDDIGDGTDF